MLGNKVLVWGPFVLNGDTYVHVYKEATCNYDIFHTYSKAISGGTQTNVVAENQEVVMNH